MSFPLTNAARALIVRTGKGSGKRIAVRADRLFVLLLTLCLHAEAHAAPAQPTLETSDVVATAGYFQLSWAGGAGADEFVVQQSRNARFEPATLLYRGADLATVISGRRNGDYYFRVRAIGPDGDGSAWSDVVHVEVAHHPLSRAFGFFGVGALMFLATLGVLIHGARRYG